ncbi:hypothetical protein [Litoribacillus peritrichatus]|uniref:Uncharacterized protein n=1 Tax=Litoribacillus peritrichatus TaxID=718191 RepID=A0ABP7MNG3_9GAMM
MNSTNTSISNSKERLINQVKQAITAKAIISAASIGMFIPFVKLVYWVFDTSYLGGFGVSPDIFSRPVFSSGFVSSWLVVKSMGIVVATWSIVALIFFIILTTVNIGPGEEQIPDQSHSQGADKQKDGIAKTKLSKFLVRLVDAIERSFDWPMYTWVGGLAVFFLLAFSTIWASNKGNELAEQQRDLYLESGFCADKFNSSNVGCFRIQGVDGQGHFIIANSQTHIIYLSRNSKENCQPEIILNILERDSKAQYSINRQFIQQNDLTNTLDTRASVKHKPC